MKPDDDRPADPINLDAARASLTECGKHTADDGGISGPCRRPVRHPGFCDPVPSTDPYKRHLRNAIAEVDRLTSINDDLVTDLGRQHGRLRDRAAEVDRLTAEAADYVAVCPYCMARVSACDEERCCATCGTDLVVCTDDHGADMLLLALNEAASGDVTKWMVGCENKRVERIRLDDEITAARLIATGKVPAEHARDIAGLVGEVETLRADRDRLTADLANARAKALEEAARVCEERAATREGAAEQMHETGQYRDATTYRTYAAAERALAGTLSTLATKVTR